MIANMYRPVVVLADTINYDAVIVSIHEEAIPRYEAVIAEQDIILAGDRGLCCDGEIFPELKHSITAHRNFAPVSKMGTYPLR